MVRLVFTLTIAFALCVGHTLLAQDTSRARFEEKYRAWKERISKPPIDISSRTSDYWECNEGKALLGEGPRIVPFFIEKIKSEGGTVGFLLGGACMRLMGKGKEDFKSVNEMLDWWEMHGEQWCKEVLGNGIEQSSKQETVRNGPRPTPNQEHVNWLLPVLSIAFVVLAGIVLFLLFRRKKLRTG